MDALMELVIRLAPRANQPDERKAFVDDLFSNSAAHQAFGPSGVKPLIEVLMNMSSDWRKVRSVLNCANHDSSFASLLGILRVAKMDGTCRYQKVRSGHVYLAPSHLSV